MAAAAAFGRGEVLRERADSGGGGGGRQGAAEDSLLQYDLRDIEESLGAGDVAWGHNWTQVRKGP